MNKFIKTAVASSLFALATAAQADIVAVDVYTPGGATLIVSQVTDFDWNSNGAAVVKDGGPFGTVIAPGTVLDSLVQTNLTGFNRGPDAVGSGDILAGLNNTFATGGYEITAVASFTEIVVASSPNTATFAVLGGSVSIFFDNTAAGGTKSALAAGTGFDDGTLIYSGNIVFGTAGFNVIGNTGLGSTNLTAQTTFLDSTAIQGLVGNLLNIFLNAEGQAAYPPGNADTNNYHIGGSALYPNYVVDANDLKLRFDGSSRFLIPEPNSIALLGVILVGAGAVVRRVRKSA